MPKSVRSPFETLKPAKSMIASLGTGRQADSSVISTKTAGSPVEEMKSVQTLMIGSRIRSLTLARTMLARINMVVAAGPG